MLLCILLYNRSSTKSPRCKGGCCSCRYPPPHMRCMNPPPSHMPCMYPPPHMTCTHAAMHAFCSCRYPPPHMPCSSMHVSSSSYDMHAFRAGVAHPRYPQVFFRFFFSSSSFRFRFFLFYCSCSCLGRKIPAKDWANPRYLQGLLYSFIFFPLIRGRSMLE
jgi:hypothetical protein